MMFSITEYLSLIAGGLTYVISLILVMISFKMKYRSRIFPLRLVSFFLIVLGSILVGDVFLQKVAVAISSRM